MIGRKTAWLMTSDFIGSFLTVWIPAWLVFTAHMTGGCMLFSIGGLRFSVFLIVHQLGNIVYGLSGVFCVSDSTCIVVELSP